MTHLRIVYYYNVFIFFVEHNEMTNITLFGFVKFLTGGDNE
jgi:hypothetical protein